MNRRLIEIQALSHYRQHLWRRVEVSGIYQPATNLRIVKLMVPRAVVVIIPTPEEWILREEAGFLRPVWRAQLAQWHPDIPTTKILHIPADAYEINHGMRLPGAVHDLVERNSWWRRFARSVAGLAVVLREDRVLEDASTPPKDEEEDMERFTNHYDCDRCGHHWEDTWSCECDDDCPKCGRRHISPTESVKNHD